MIDQSRQAGIDPCTRICSFFFFFFFFSDFLSLHFSILFAAAVGLSIESLLLIRSTSIPSLELDQMCVYVL